MQTAHSNRHGAPLERRALKSQGYKHCATPEHFPSQVLNQTTFRAKLLKRKA